MSKMIVAKFGGSSIRNVDGMLECARYLASHPEVRLVVISAIYNVTNRLEQIAQSARSNEMKEVSEMFEELRRLHRTFAFSLGALEDSSSVIDTLIEEGKSCATIISNMGWSGRQMDRLYSIGERLSSALFCFALRKEGIRFSLLDAREYIITDQEFGKANVLRDQTLNKMSALKLGSEKQIYVTQGFIGSTEAGVTTTLGREGSDYSATLFAAGLLADEVQIWTDVSGVKVVDPKVFENDRTIKKLSYEEATAMASLGAKVLYSKTMEPVKELKIPIQVGSVKFPKGPFTHIGPESSNREFIGIAIDESEGKCLLSIIGHQSKVDLLEEKAPIEVNALFKSFVVDKDNVPVLVASLMANQFHPRTPGSKVGLLHSP